MKTLSAIPYISMVQAGAILCRDRKYLGWLCRQYGIPTVRGPKNSRSLSPRSVELLRLAIEDHESKPDPDLLVAV